MQLAEYFEDVVVLRAEEADSSMLQWRLHEQGRRSWSLDLSAGPAWRDTLAQVLDRARAHHAPGVLLLLPGAQDDRRFWRSQDHLVEHLDCREWDIVYLGHGLGGACVDRDNLRTGLVHCDVPPGQVSAIAVRCGVLDQLVHVMPGTGADGPLAPDDWLVIACWLAQGLTAPGSGWAAWPPLMH